MTPLLRSAKNYSLTICCVILSVVFMLIIPPVLMAAESKTTQADAPSKWENDIQAFEQWDRKNSFPSNAVLFIGSSSIRLWETRQCFPDLPVINRGFGGSQIAEITPFIGRIVVPYQPRAIVFYAGDNDIAAGKSPQTITNDFRDFVRGVRETLADAPIYFLSIKPSPSRWSMWLNASHANKLIRDFCRSNPGLHYVDLASCLLQEDGTPNPLFYLPDNLHLNAQGYKIWTQILAPSLRDVFAEFQSSVGMPAVGRMSSGSATPTPQQPPINENSGPWFAAKNSKIFHRSGCSFLGRISKENLLEFSSRDQAASGRRPCKTCNP